MNRIICFFLFFSFFGTFAQTICDQGSYKISQSKGCSPFTITFDYSGLTTIGCNSFIPYVDNNSFVGTSFTFTSPGIYSVKVESGACTLTSSVNCRTGGGNTFPTQTVTVLSTPSPNPIVTGCSNNKAFVATESNSYDKYTIDWGDGTNTTVGRGQIIEHQYAAPNTNQNIFVSGYYEYTVNGIVGIQSCPTPQSKKYTVNVKNAINPQPKITKLIANSFASTGSGFLFVETDKNFPYRVLEKQGINGTFSPITTITNGDVQITVGNIKDQKCYQIESFDNCGNISSSGVDVCAISISATANNSGNSIQFETHPTAGSASYLLSVNGVSFFKLDTTTGVFFTFGNTSDKNVECQQTYCYRHTAVFGTQNIESVSPPFCVESLKPSTFTGVKDVNSSFENGNLVLSWKASTTSGVTYVAYTSDGAGNIVRMDSTQNNSLNAKNQNSSCYAITQKDKCGTGPANETCPMRITGQKDNLVQNSMQSNAYKNGDNTPVTEYFVEMYTDEGQFIESRSLGSSPIFIHNPINEDHQKVRYRFKAVVPTSDGGTKDVYSTFIEIKQDLRLWVPNAFTPNGDGLNDTFFPKGLFFDKYNIQIYSRWGQVVFSSTDKNKQWDGGQFNPGIYQYFIEVQTKYGDKMSDKGELNLVR